MKKLIIILLLITFTAVAQLRKMTDKELKEKKNIEMETDVFYKNIFGGVDSVIHYTIYRNGTWKKNRTR